MNFAKQAQGLIKREILPLLEKDWQVIYAKIYVDIKDLSTYYEEWKYLDLNGDEKYVPNYGDSWDLHLLVGSWYEHDLKTRELKYRWNKIQFEIDPESYAVVTSWDQEYYNKVYPNG